MSVAAIYPAYECSPRAAGLDEIRGSTPNHAVELVGSVLHAGFADPGPTCCAITSFIALATEGELIVPRSVRLFGDKPGRVHRRVILNLFVRPLGPPLRPDLSFSRAPRVVPDKAGR